MDTKQLIAALDAAEQVVSADRACALVDADIDALDTAVKAMRGALPSDAAGAPRFAIDGKPTEKGIYAWIVDGSAALVHVHKRPTDHSPGNVLNGSLIRNCTFYDGCAIEQWSGGTWYGPLKHPAAPAAPAAPTTTVNLEGLRKKLLTPREIKRDESGWLWHMDYPVCDEGTRADKFLEAFGIETSFVSMESDLPDFAERWHEEGLTDCSKWMPTPPAGDGWLLLEIYDTEDGPYAMFGRDKYEAENALKRQRTRELSERIQQRTAAQGGNHA